MGSSRKPKYVVGIDLGTTNSAVAYANIASAKRHGTRAVKLLQIPQLVAAGEVASADMLPSSLYLPMGHEAPDTFRLPWSESTTPQVVGQFAQRQGARVPGRLVTSAKSWLSYSGVDRTADILPWGAQDDVPKVSPIVASSHYLAHILAAWNHAFPKAPLEQQEVVLTVPASFDDVARTLTLRAAESVGLGEHLMLLEEPQAAFYDYFRTHSQSLKEASESQQILVVDVGGGTTDFTLIQVDWRTEDGESLPEVKRIAIGDHILLGGDNMDLALAHLAEARISGQRGALDAPRMSALVQSCRQAKEVLLAEDAPETFRVAIPGRGTKLIGGAQSCELSHAEVEAIVLDGFAPRVGVTDRPQRSGRSALSAWGLPYASDPGITRHIAAFLNRHGGVDGAVQPDGILLNGGVFKSDAIRRRIVETISSWQGQPPAVVPAGSYDLAVARGAATYGLVRHGVGHRIGGGAARAYYVGVHQGKKRDRRRQGVCILPRQAEPGVPVLLKDRVFQLVLGRPVRFSLFATTAERHDSPGQIVDLKGEDFLELPPIQTVLETEEDVRDLPVTLCAELTELGILEVSAQSVDRDTRYRLEFSLRAQEGAERESDEPNEPPRASLSSTVRDQLEDIFRRTYGKPRKDVDPREIKWLRRSLETTLEKGRDEWSAGVCRSVWDLLKVGMRRRRRSERHEATFFHLTGFCLRPGFGDPFDEWRVSEVLKLYEPGVHFLKDAEVWTAWWIMWRRLAGGLDESAQTALLDWVEPWLRPPADARNRKKPKMMGETEATRLVGGLERIPVARKIDWGDWFLERLSGNDGTGIPAWCLGRLGARQPFYGSSHLVVSREVATGWLERLLALDWSKVRFAAMAAATIARKTGDRARDLDAVICERVAARLDKVPSMSGLSESVRTVVALSEQDERKIFGDSLPEGLKLVSD